MKYLEYEIFNKYYPIGKLLTEGGSEKRNIFRGKSDNYIVKENKDFQNYITEVNFYCSFNHPCIAKIDVISYNNKSFYFKMEKGEDIEVAFLSNKIKLNEIASDTLSAIDYLHKKGIGHFDIKDINIIYLNGKATLIDFGYTSRCQPYIYHEKKDFFCNDVRGYTELYNDPQFFEFEQDSIRTDLYAFGVTLYDLYRIKFDKIKAPWKERSSNPYPNLKNIRDGNLRNFISECIKPWNIRKSTEELLKHPFIIRKYEVDDYIPWIFPHTSYSNEKCFSFNKVIVETCKIMDKENLLTKEAFDIVHNLHICLDVINPTYNPEISNKVSLLMLYIVYLLESSEYRDTKIKNKKISEEDFKIIFRLLDILNGQITHTTYYSLISDKSKYPILFEDTLKCSYNPNYIRTDFRDVKIIKDDYDKFRNIYPLINFDRISLDEKISNIRSNYHYDKFPSISLSKYEDSIRKVMKYNNPTDENYNIIMNYMEFLPKIDRKLYSDFIAYMSKTSRRKAILDMINETLKEIR